MFVRISEKITNRLIKKDVIGCDDRDIYQYGIERLLMTALNLLTAVLIGTIFVELGQSLVFVAAFMAIRPYAGGYHASTPVRCYLLTSFIIMAVLSVMKYMKFNIFICPVLLAVSSLVILLLAPVESKNKPLDSMEKMFYRKKTIIIWCIETFAAIVFALLKLNAISECFVMAELILGLSLIAGTVKLKMDSTV